MKNTIYQLRDIEMKPELAAKLWPFINAYRPHDPAPTWQELKAEGFEKIEEESLMDIIVDQHEYDKELAEAT